MKFYDLINTDAGSSDSKPNVKVHNLIILDESGSMLSIYNPAISGLNETLQTIRGAQKNHPDQTHLVTLVTFNSGNYNRIYDSTLAENTSDITPAQYRPSFSTPLFDAIGRSVGDLRPHVGKDDIVLVTIITDGYENASCEYNGKAIKTLIEELKAGGWVFTYIGANQDVEAVAESISIDNHLSFTADSEGTNRMFEKDKASRMRFFDSLSSEEDREYLCCNYFKD